MQTLTTAMNGIVKFFQTTQPLGVIYLGGGILSMTSGLIRQDQQFFLIGLALTAIITALLMRGAFKK